MRLRGDGAFDGALHPDVVGAAIRTAVLLATAHGHLPLAVMVTDGTLGVSEMEFGHSAEAYEKAAAHWVLRMRRRGR